MPRHPEKVMGHVVPAPRVTRAGIALMVLHLGLPVFGALVLVDVIVWAAGQALFDTCIGVWCWF